MAASKSPSRWSRFKGVVRRPLAGIKNPLLTTKHIDPNQLALESLENRVLLSTIEYLVGPHAHDDIIDNMQGNGSSLDDTIIDLLNIDDNPKGIESLEPRIMKSATWVDADTGDSIAGATEGDDIFNAGGGNNNDIVDALGGDDTLFGNNGDDILNGGAGDDEIHGGNHSDTLLGGTGDDVLYGDNHDDILVSGGGNDVMYGGQHNDTFQFTGAQNGDVITVDGGKHTDTIDLSEYSSSQVSDNGSTIIVDMGDEESFTINYIGIENIIVGPVVISIDATDPDAAEPDDDGLFTISRTGDTLENLLVKYNLTGTAENGIDYALLAGTVTIPAGQDSVEVILDVIDDSLVEDTEIATLTLLEDPAYTIAQASSETVTILDDDGNGLPKLSIDATDPDAAEPDDDGLFTIHRTGDVLGNLLVKYEISGTADNGIDYALLAGTVTIPAGQDSVEVILDVIDDSLVEDTEIATLTLLEDPAYTIAQASSETVTILDDDGNGLPKLSIDATDPDAAEPDDDGLFTIHRTGDALGNLLVKYEISGTADNGADYVLIQDTVTIPDGQNSIDILIDVLDDDLLEDTEHVTLTLLDDAAYEVVNQNSDTVNILDDDSSTTLPPAIVSIDATDPTATEPDDDGRFTITRVGSVLGDLLVLYDISGTAENGADYAFLTGSIIIPDGMESIVVPIDVINDPIGEGTEFVLITLLEDPAYTVGPADSAQVTIDDEGLALPFGQAPGLARKVVFSNDEGIRATVIASRLTGTLFFDGDSVTTMVMKKTIFVQGDNLSIEKILLDTTSERSALTVKTKGINHPAIDIDEILVTGSLRKLNAKSVNVTEGIDVEGSLGMLRVGTFAPNTYLSIHSGSFRPLKIKVTSIGPDTVLDLAGQVKLLKAGSFPSGLLTADSLKKVVIKDGPFGTDVLARTGSITSIKAAGDISGDISAKGSIRSVFSKTGSIDADILAETGDIGSVRARGLIAGSIVANGNIQRVISRTGDLTAAVRAGKDITTVRAVNLDSAIISAGANIGFVTVKENILNSYILAGYDIGSDAAFGLQGPGGFDMAGSGNITAVTAGGQFDASYIAAGTLPLTPLTADFLPDLTLPFVGDFGSISRVRFGSIELDNDFEFGLFAASDIGPIFLDNQSLDEITDPFVIRVLNP